MNNTKTKSGKVITVRKNQITNAKEAIMWHLKTKTITSIQAMQLYGTTRLAVHICALRKQGYNIITIPVEHKTFYGTTSTYAKYKYINPMKSLDSTSKQK